VTLVITKNVFKVELFVGLYPETLYLIGLVHNSHHIRLSKMYLKLLQLIATSW